MEKKYELLEGKFNELILGLTRNVDFEQWPNRIFLFRGDDFLFEYSLDTGYLGCQLVKVWNILKFEGRYNLYEINSFIKTKVKEYFKLMEVPNLYLFDKTIVEEHFKNK